MSKKEMSTKKLMKLLRERDGVVSYTAPEGQGMKVTITTGGSVDIIAVPRK